MYRKPKFPYVSLIIGILIILFGFFSGDLAILIVMLINGLFVIGLFLYIYKHRLDRYNLRKKDYTAYQELIKQEKDKQIKIKKEELALLPKCPVCDTKEYVRKISTGERTISIAITGLASNKIGKQYECKHCKHKW